MQGFQRYTIYRGMMAMYGFMVLPKHLYYELSPLDKSGALIPLRLGIVPRRAAA